MEKSLSKETNNLLSYITDETLKQPDKSGTTPLLYKAFENSKLSPLSAEKKFQENVVCNLIEYFPKLNQINLSELESYIIVSEFSGEKILEAFADYVINEDSDEDLVFKACVTRIVQSLNRTTFSLEFVSNRFAALPNLDPWLFAELIITCNWREGVKMIKSLLKTNPDTSYLFSILPTWMKDEKNEEKISIALSEWYELFNESDRKIADYYAKEFGYKINTASSDIPEINTSVINTIIEDSGFSNFLHSRVRPNYKTLPTC